MVPVKRYIFFFKYDRFQGNFLDFRTLVTHDLNVQSEILKLLSKNLQISRPPYFVNSFDCLFFLIHCHKIKINLILLGSWHLQVEVLSSSVHVYFKYSYLA